MSELHQALEGMVFQFGYRGVKNGQPTIWTGGLSALEEAFWALGWDNPHYLPEEGFTCAIVGCLGEDTTGTRWAGLYLRLCPQHYDHAKSLFERPPVKAWALEREAKRGEDGILL